MIIENGHIELKYKRGGVLDEDGFPVIPGITFGSPIPCQYQAVKYSLLEKSYNEAYKLARFEILVETTVIDSEELRLFDCKNNLVGEFSIIQPIFLRAVDQIKILV